MSQCLKCESASRRYQPGEGPSRAVIVKTDCETDGSFYSTTQNKEVFAEAAAVASPLHPDTLVTRYRPGFLSGPQHYQE